MTAFLPMLEARFLESCTIRAGIALGSGEDKEAE
jgi:hypothetical protein